MLDKMKNTEKRINSSQNHTQQNHRNIRDDMAYTVLLLFPLLFLIIYS